MKHSHFTLLRLAWAGIFIPAILAIAAEPTASVTSGEALKKLTDGGSRSIISRSNYLILPNNS